MGAGAAAIITKAGQLVGNIASTIGDWNAAKKAEASQKEYTKGIYKFGSEVGARYDRPENEISSYWNDVLGQAKDMPVETESRQSGMVRNQLMASLGVASGEIEDQMGGGVGGAEALAKAYVGSQDKLTELGIANADRYDRMRREKTSTMIGAFSKLAAADERKFAINEDRYRQAQDTADILRLTGIESKNVAGQMSAAKYAQLGGNLDNMITQATDMGSMVSAGKFSGSGGGVSEPTLGNKGV